MESTISCFSAECSQNTRTFVQIMLLFATFIFIYCPCCSTFRSFRLLIRIIMKCDYRLAVVWRRNICKQNKRTRKRENCYKNSFYPYYPINASSNRMHPLHREQNENVDMMIWICRHFYTEKKYLMHTFLFNDFHIVYTIVNNILVNVARRSTKKNIKYSCPHFSRIIFCCFIYIFKIFSAHILIHSLKRRFLLSQFAVREITCAITCI